MRKFYTSVTNMSPWKEAQLML